jgi:hypothetical protein
MPLAPQAWPNPVLCPWERSPLRDGKDRETLRNELKRMYQEANAPQ